MNRFSISKLVYCVHLFLRFDRKSLVSCEEISEVSFLERFGFKALNIEWHEKFMCIKQP